MAKRPTKTWIVVADGARARFFSPDREAAKLVPTGPADLVAPASRLRSRDLKSDKPGRSFSASRSGVRHAFEPPHDYHKLEKHRFMATLAGELDDACARRAFDDLILVAPRRSLGELRGLLSKKVQERVRQEVAKDLTNEPPSRLRRRLGAVLGADAGSPVRAGRPSRTS
ncbi:MAG: host attachment protein [Reyranellaceae bacterium]